MGIFVLPVMATFDSSRVRDGGGHARASRDIAWDVLETLDRAPTSQNSCKQGSVLPTLARSRSPPSLGRGSTGQDLAPRFRAPPPTVLLVQPRRH
jgi:hypothetical protein